MTIRTILFFHVVDKHALQFTHGVRGTPDCAWPLDTKAKERSAQSPGHLWRLDGASLNMSSSISCIKKFGKPEGNRIATLGSDTSGGSVSVLNLSHQHALPSGLPMIQGNFYEIASFNRTVWTADCNSRGSQALIGTNLGVTLLNIETGSQLWVCRCKSDIFSVQMDQSENSALCGLRNGAIVNVDFRLRPHSNFRLTRQRVALHSNNTRKSLSGASQNAKKHWFEFMGSIHHHGTISMPSSISCHNMFTSQIKLYDQRMVQRGAVQSYEGNVNSHTKIQLGVDPSENFVASGYSLKLM
nr:PREDICTED: uncharacterized protein LOC108216509 [Daucus carota subsp. sativus]